jgi:hypothetical protein
LPFSAQPPRSRHAGRARTDYRNVDFMHGPVQM